jgi:endonuclease/exonuclease/phosphatase (EEP) superfamily protein YafD
LIQRLARGVVVLVAAATVGLVAGYAVGPEHFWLLALAQYVPYPAFLLTTLVALALSWRIGRAFRLAAFVSLVLVCTRVAGLEFGRSEAGSGPIRLMTYNIKDYNIEGQAGGLEEIGREIDRHDPDIVVLQDARSLAGEDSPADVLKVLGFYRWKFSFGQYVVASRFPLQDCARGDIPFRLRPHTYVRCVVIAHGTEFELATTHFITPRSALAAIRANPLGAIGEWKENVADRMAQAEKLAWDLRPHQRPLIVAGDFNAPDTSLVVRRFFEIGLRDAFAVGGFGYGYTWGHSLRFGLPFLRIDHILVGTEIGVANCFVGGTRGSEHRPVIADLYVTRAKN